MLEELLGLAAHRVQTVGLHKLIRVFAGCICDSIGFCCAPAEICFY